MRRFQGWLTQIETAWFEMFLFLSSNYSQSGSPIIKLMHRTVGATGNGKKQPVREAQTLEKNGNTSWI